MTKGIIILLNGVSSSGKSTLAQVLQDKLEQPFYYLAQDMFCHLVSARHRKSDFRAVTQRSISAMHHTIACFSDLGLGVIVDHILLDTPEERPWLRECIQLLHAHPVLFVGVWCPLEELERREAARGNRRKGQARGQLNRSYDHTIYDFVVNTYENTPEACAEKIIDAIAHPERWAGFRRSDC